MVKVLFVSMGNICRSPAAEGIFKTLIKKHNIGDHIYCESAGTSGHHVGSPPDERMCTHAQRRGHRLDSLARQFQTEDFVRFDYIITMDHANYRNVTRLDPGGLYKEKVIPLAKLCLQLNVTEVPDPYYGESNGFEQVLDILEDGCLGLLDRLNLVKFRAEK